MSSPNHGRQNGCGGTAINCRSLPRQKQEMGGFGIGAVAADYNVLSYDDSLVSRGNGNRMRDYELSEDFQQKQLEILERKYGGRLRCRRAAVIIQRAYRKYCLEKKFRNLRTAGSQRRSLNRFHTTGQLRTEDGARGGPWSLLADSSRGFMFAERRHIVVQASSSMMQQQQALPWRQPTTSDQATNKPESMASRLKLHRYNVGKPHMSAPLTAQLRADRQQQSTTGPGSSSSTVRVTIGDVGRQRTVADSRPSVASYRPPGVQVLRNRALSAERPSVGGPEFGLNAGDKRTEMMMAPCSSSELVGEAAMGAPGGSQLSSDSYAAYIRVAPPRAASVVTVEQQKSQSPVKSISIESPIAEESMSTTVSSPSNSDVWLPRVGESCQRKPDNPSTSSLGTTTSSSSSSSSSSTTTTSTAPIPMAVLARLPDETKPVLNRSLPESNWIRHWGRRSLINAPHRQSELERKRQYRIALNFFNKKPERGVQFLVDFGFVEGTPTAVAKLLLSRKGLSKEKIGEYLGNLMNSFNMAVLEAFANEVDMRDLELDVALRRFQSLFRIPGEAQKIERIMEAFARRYCSCNPEVVKQFNQPDTIFLLAFAIIMLNTDLHSPNIKQERRMKLEDFLKNLRGIDAGSDVNPRFLNGIYQRVKEQEFKPGSDHVTQVLKVDRSIIGKKPILALPHRRLVCFVRLFEVQDPKKRQAPNVHQREIFLFNDMLLITKIATKKKSAVAYAFRSCHTLVGMQVQSFKNEHYANGLRINHTLENKTLFFNARSEEDRTKFLEDLKESVCESDEMEALRIELELEKQNSFCGRSQTFSRDEQRDSGLQMDDVLDQSKVYVASPRHIDSAANRVREPRQRRSSITSLDSGMSSTASTVSRESSPPTKNSRSTVSDSSTTDGAASTSGVVTGGARRCECDQISQPAPDTSEV